MANFKAALFRTLGFEGVTVQKWRNDVQETPRFRDGANSAETDMSEAPLTHEQEMTFCRIANAGAPPSVLRPKDVERLLALGLVKKGPRRFILTDVGQARFNEHGLRRAMSQGLGTEN